MDKADKVINAMRKGARFSSGALLVTPHGQVFSYDVCLFDGERLHTRKYSSTTSGHQNVLRRALDYLGVEYVETTESLGKVGAV